MNIPNSEEWLMMEEFDKLFYLQNILSEQEYINVVKDWYTQTEIVYQNLQLWIDTFKSIKNTKLLMDYD